MSITPPKTATNTPERIIRPSHGLIPINFTELFHYRELFFFLAWRDILIRYKQTALGVFWAIIQPLMMMVVFTVVFGRLANLPSEGAPYPVMTFAALLPWQFFANAMSQSSNSVVGSANLIRKVYFPRLIIPASATLSGVADLLISFLILMVLMLWYEVSFRIQLLLLPVFFLLAFLTAFGMGLWLGALNVKYRDVKHIIPYIVTLGLFISPVGFMSGVVPDKWQFLYSLNPMVSVIDGFRWCILGPKFVPYWLGFCTSAIAIAIVLISGVYFFRKMEKSFADII